MDELNNRPRSPDTESKVAFLRSAAAYAHQPGLVSVIETHMSWLFLADGLVYKLKKPMKFPFLDFTTLGRRRRYCEVEVRLNRRLAGGIYRRIAPLCLDQSGHLALDGDGTVVDWLVEMDQLSEDRFLHTSITKGTVTREAVSLATERLTRFYAGAPRQRRDGQLYLNHLVTESGVNRRLLGRPTSRLPLARTTDLLDRVEALLTLHIPEIRERIAMGCIVDGHGDLRPEHVWFGPPPAIIDCLEFDRRMRIIDPYDELNYLGLECELLGADWIRPLVLERLEQVIGRPPTPGLAATYGAFRAMLRARICIAHLLDPHPSRPHHWPPVARRYLDIAARECLIAEGGEAGGSSHHHVTSGWRPPATERN